MSSSNASAPCIKLKQGRDGPIRKRHHPWIYSQAVDSVIPADSPDQLLPVQTADGAVIGWGEYSEGSLIAVRMVSFGAERPAPDWLDQRIREAKQLRDSLSIDSDAMRLVNAEGDFVPGLVADRYADTVVLSAHTRCIESSLDAVAESFAGIVPDVRVFVKRDEHFARVEKLVRPSEYLRGTGEGTAVITEGGVRMLVDFSHGQKTGFYLDQRMNRGIIARASAGKSVLNLFCYTGAVALRAVAAGATKVTSVDSSHRALEIAEESVLLNPSLGANAFEWIQGDVFSYLEEPGVYDVVVADPPPFARRRMELEGALKGYLSLFQQCLRNLSPGGFAFLFSCSGAVDRPLFQQVVSEAALKSGRRVRLIHELHADVDHPVAASHPEGEYLKGWMVHVH